MSHIPLDMYAFASFPAAQKSCIPLERGYSPRKRNGHSSSPLRGVLADRPNVSLPPPAAPAFSTDSPVKRPLPAAYQPIAPHPPTSALFATFASFGAPNDENAAPRYRSDNFAEFPGSGTGSGSESNAPKGHKKRLSSDVGDGEDRRDTKKRRLEPIVEPTRIPEPDEMPEIVDSGQKPNYSYATLIGMSILRAPNRRLTLAQIYKWISDTFSFYRTAGDGWQNSIRHNLSLHKAFIKKERPKDDPGKGNYWAIESGMEGSFLPGVAREKSVRRQASNALKAAPTSEITHPSSSTGLPPPPTALPPIKEKRPVSQEPSSDATIPASDPALLEEVDETSMPPPRNQGALSSPLQAIHSSPPVPHKRTRSREDTPGQAVDLSSDINRSRSRKRKLNSMNDSGYYSSIESSALRPHALASGAMDRRGEPSSRCFKRGRAEEEIARLRSSSHDISPSKAKANTALLQQPTPQPLMSSSPLRPTTADSELGGRPERNSLMLPPPLTPAITLKKSRLAPPPSVSPNTNLRNHRNTIRELIGSPLKHDGTTPGGLAFSPAFHLVDDAFALGDLDDDRSGAASRPAGFSIFTDSPNSSPLKMRRALGSPAKRAYLSPAGRRLAPSGRSHVGAATPGAALADITGASANSAARAAPNPALKPPSLGSPLRYRPSGAGAGAAGRSPSKVAPPASHVASILGDLGSEEDFFGSLDLFTSTEGCADDDAGDGGSEFVHFGKRAWDVEEAAAKGKENEGPAKKKARKGASANGRPLLGMRRETAGF